MFCTYITFSKLYLKIMNMKRQIINNSIMYWFRYEAKFHYILMECLEISIRTQDVRTEPGHGHCSTLLLSLKFNYTKISIFLFSSNISKNTILFNHFQKHQFRPKTTPCTLATDKRRQSGKLVKPLSFFRRTPYKGIHSLASYWIVDLWIAAMCVGCVSRFSIQNLFFSCDFIQGSVQVNFV